MMKLKEQITADTKEALKARNQLVVSVLRMVRARVLEKEVEFRASRGRDYELSDEETVEVLSSYAKQRRQSIDSYREAGRDDLAEKEERELEIVQKYLPRQLTLEEIQSIVNGTIEELGVTGPQAMGQVMRAVMPKLKGAADGKTVNRIVKEALNN